MRDPSVKVLATLVFGSPSSVSWFTDSTTGTAGGVRHQITPSPASANTAPVAAADHAQMRLEGRPCPTAGTVAPLDSDNASKANAKSEADWKRCSGSFSTQRLTTRTRPSAVSGASSDIARGSSFRMAVNVSAEVGLSKALRPANISYKTAPKAKISVRPS